VPQPSLNRLDLGQLQELVDDTVAVVAVMAANNETGVIAPTQEVGEVSRAAGALHFVDITQLAGKGSVAGIERHADLMICSSHKIYGPKGAGALVGSRRVQKDLVPVFAGGGQERGLRGGTHNTAAIAGFGVAAELAEMEHCSDAARVGGLATDLYSRLVEQLGGVILNGDGAQRLSNTLNFRFTGADGEAVMASMPNVHVSTGSACQAAVTTHSHVLLAMGMSSDEAAQSPDHKRRNRYSGRQDRRRGEPCAGT
jgi:cysteine desulfurase